VPSLSRRTLLAGTSVAGLTTLAACGSSDDAGASASSSGAASSTTSIDTLFGTVQVPANPKNVVALGWGDMETVLALGGQVVGTSDWLAFGGDGVGPWASDLVKQTPEVLGTTELSYEAVAALTPDVILNTRQSNAQAQQDELKQIAPTVGPPPGQKVTYGTSWQDQVELVSAALGTSDAGAKLIADLEAKFKDVAAANPGFAGRTVSVAAFGDSRVDFMTELGFTQSPTVQALSTDASFYVSLSDEQLDQLEADLVVVFPIGATAAEITANPGIQNLQATRDGRIVVFDDTTQANAFSSGTTLGLGYALDHAVPLFAQAIA
jgi:iron complex transport system substrate-binding protein